MGRWVPRPLRARIATLPTLSVSTLGAKRWLAHRHEIVFLLQVLTDECLSTLFQFLGYDNSCPWGSAMKNDRDVLPRDVSGTLYIVTPKADTSDIASPGDTDTESIEQTFRTAQKAQYLLPHPGGAVSQLSREHAVDAQFVDLEHSPEGEVVEAHWLRRDSAVVVLAVSCFVVAFGVGVFYFGKATPDRDIAGPVAKVDVQSLHANVSVRDLPDYNPSELQRFETQGELPVADTVETDVGAVPIQDSIQIGNVATTPETRVSRPVSATSQKTEPTEVSAPTANEEGLEPRELGRQTEQDVMPVAIAVSPSPTRSAEQKSLSQNQDINDILKQGQSLMDRGNVAAARAVFRKAADQGLAEAALAMGATYDPKALAANGWTEVEPNVGKAIYWYRRAHLLASAGAQKNG